MHELYQKGEAVRSGHFVGLKFDDGWWFIQVLNTSVIELKPWQLLNENGNRAEIAADTTGNEDKILDENSRELLEPDDDERDLIHQVLTGIAPSRMRLIPSFGRNQNLGLETSLEGGSDESWVNGFDSPYNSPTQQSELFVINNQPDLKLQAYNPMSEPKAAKLSFFINKLKYATVTDMDMMKAMLQNQITSRKHPMGLGAVGKNQMDTPQWVRRAFGEHIHETEEILREGDSSNASGDVTFDDAVDLQNGGA